MEENTSPEQEPNYVSPCGGPLLCPDCAMKHAETYMQNGREYWANLYYRHAVMLRNQYEIERLQEENRRLFQEKIELEKQAWKAYTHNG